MIKTTNRILTNFDFAIPIIVVIICSFSMLLVSEINEKLFLREVMYLALSIVVFFMAFIIQYRKYSWIIPVFYWLGIGLLVLVQFIGVVKLGARRWIEIPFIHLTIQPSEFIKPIIILMLAHKIHMNPPEEDGYDVKDFLRLLFYTVLPAGFVLLQPDLGTAIVILFMGVGTLFVVKVKPKIWISLLVAALISAPFGFSKLHDYQKQRIMSLIDSKPSYHVQQSMISIGSGGFSGRAKEDATQAQLKFLPIASSDFIYAYSVERFGFVGGISMLTLYGLLIMHLLIIAKNAKKDYMLMSVSSALAFLLFIHVAVNIAMTLGLAPVVGIPLPFFSYGGSSTLTFFAIFGILENLLAFRFNFMYNYSLRD